MDSKYIIFGFVMIQISSGSIPDVKTYFPNIDKDASKITWGHAINSMSLLDEAISNESYMMLEADVLKGRLKNESSSSKQIPIMAHPPETTSDLSLQMFIDKVIKANEEGKKIGVKLDFKDLDIVQPSLEALRKQKNKLTFPLWLNADILVGPGGENVKPVDAEIFLSLCAEFFPDATLSIGWTTGSGDKLKYTNDQIDQMIAVLSNSSSSQPITFPIRAAFVNSSLGALEKLYRSKSGYTFTIWTSSTDKVNISDLANFQNEIGMRSVYFDLPEDQIKELRRLNKKSPIENSGTEAFQRKAGGNNAPTNFNSHVMFIGCICVAISVLSAQYFR